MPFIILFHFVCDYGVLREIQLIRKPGEPEREKQWMWKEFGKETVLLKCDSRQDRNITFSEGNLVFDDSEGTFVFRDKTYKLKRTK